MTAQTILVVEDNPITRKMLRFALESEGYSVVDAGDARAALAAVGRQRPELVLSDYVLPDTDGLRLLDELRKSPGASELPAIVLTGMVSQLDELRARAGAATIFLPKPVEPSRLIEVVRTQLARPGATPGRGRRVLVVDDDRLNQKLASIRLADAGFQVATASDGEEALRQARLSPPDVILSDVLMPGMDGFRLCRAVREDARLASIPLVLLSSSYAEEADRQLALEMGASVLLTRTPDLTDAIDALVKSLAEGAGPAAPRGDANVEVRHSERVQRQLEHQMARNDALLRQGAIQAAALSVLRGLAEALAHPQDLTSVLADVLVHCLDAAGLSTGLLYLVAPGGGLRLHAQAGVPAWSLEGARACFGYPEFLERIVASGEPTAVVLGASEAQEEAPRAFALGLGQSFLVAPLGARGQRLGALILASETQHLAEPVWLGFARTLAVQFGQTIAVGQSLSRGVASEARYRSLVEHANDAILVLDPKHQVLETNKQAERLLARPRNEIIGRSYDDFVAPAERGDAESHRQEVLTLRSTLVPRRHLVRPDGTLVTVEVSGALVQVGEDSVVLAILRDITDRERNEALRAVEHAVTRMLSEAPSFAEASGRILLLLCEGLEWDVAALWTVDAGAGILHCADVKLAPPAFQEATLGLQLPRGQGLAGRVWASGAPEHIPDLAADTGFARASAAQAEGLRSGLAFPIVSAGKTTGVIEFFSRKPRGHDEALLKMMESVGAQIGQFLERRLAEEEKARFAADADKERRRLESIISTVPGIVWESLGGLEGARTNFVSPQVEALLGYPVEEWRAKPDFWLTITHPEDREGAAAATSAIFASGTSGTNRFRFIARDGRVLWVESHMAVARDEAGRSVGLRGVTLDVTERMRAEAALRRSEARMRSVLDAALDAVIAMDARGLVVSWNPRAEAIFGWSQEEAIGRRLAELIIPERYREAHVKGLELFLATGVGPVLGRRIEMSALRRDGTEFPVELTINALKEDAGFFFNAFVGDISERKRLEDQLRQAQKMEAVGQLAGGVAHDFNNLLGVITGYNELLLRDLGPQHPGRRRVEQIKRAAERATDLTRQLLAFSRKQVLQPKVLDLNGVVTDVEKMLRRLIGEDVQLVTVLHAELGRVQADPGQMEQVIVNLSVNARDAMPKGGTLILETANVDVDQGFAQSHAGLEPGPHVLLAVSDTGHGMDAETLSRIFEPFFTTKEAGKGTGLGLATVYGIVKQSGGHVTAYSEPGRGTTFKVYLPRVEGEREALAAAAEPSPAGSETILLVEDAEALRLMVREILEDAGYRVLEADSAEAALELAAAHAGPVHLLVTDVVMPRLSGRDVAERLKAARPDVRVLYTSGYTDEAIGHHGVLDRGTHFLQKPFTTDALLRKVREVLDEG